MGKVISMSTLSPIPAIPVPYLEIFEQCGRGGEGRDDTHKNVIITLLDL